MTSLLHRTSAIIIPFLAMSTIVSVGVNGQHYDHTLAIFQTYLDPSRYKAEVIPVTNQSEVILVQVDFSLISIVAVDDTTQSFVCNGVLSFHWLDQRIQWDPDLHGGKRTIHPLPKEVWRPRVILVNTMDERDIFGDDFSPLVINANGTAVWAAGSLISTSCSLSLLKYPFDEQKCFIKMMSMGLLTNELMFVAGKTVMTLYGLNGEWQVLNVNISTSASVIDHVSLPTMQVSFHIKRRPAFYLLTIILPFVLLSFLNMQVFSIPMESGEKISYGITVLLALSVFFSIIGGMLPRSSNVVPSVIIYLFMLYLISALAVIDSIVIVSMHHSEQTEDNHKRLFHRVKHVVQKILRNQRVTDAFPSPSTTSSTILTEYNDTIIDQRAKSPKLQSFELCDILEQRHLKEKGYVKEKPEAEVQRRQPMKFSVTASILNTSSFYIFHLVWLCATLWFFGSVAS